MVKAVCSEEEFLDLLLDLVHTAWKESEVPKDWSDALLVPIPKKGNLSNVIIGGALPYLMLLEK